MAEWLVGLEGLVEPFKGAVLVPEEVGNYLCALAFEVGQLEAVVDKADYDLRGAMIISGIWRKPVVAYPLTCAVEIAAKRLWDQYDELRQLHADVELERGMKEDAQDSLARVNEEFQQLSSEKLTLLKEQAQLRKENEELRLSLRWTTNGDKPLKKNEEDAIFAAFPTRSGRHDLYAEAVRIVDAKQSKYGLVGVVNWLLHERLALRGESSLVPGADAMATLWETKAMEFARVLDVWAHDKACARLHARHGGRAPVPCDCNLDHHLTPEFCTRIDQEKTR